MQVSPASGSKDRVARCLLECLEKFKTSKPSTFPPLLLHALCAPRPSFRLLNSLSLSLLLISSSAHFQCHDSIFARGRREEGVFPLESRNDRSNDNYIAKHGAFDELRSVRKFPRLENRVSSFARPPRARIDSCDESSSSIVIVILIVVILTGGNHDDDWAESAFVS